MFGSKENNLENIDLYSSSNKVSLIHYEEDFANFAEFYRRKQLPQKMWLENKINSKSTEKYPLSKLLIKFYQLCFDSIQSSQTKKEEKDPAANLKNIIKNIKTEFYNNFKDSIDSLQDGKEFDERIKAFINILKDTDGNKDKIRNLKTLMINLK